MKTSDHILFRDVSHANENAGKKTKTWHVEAVTGHFLGEVKWYASWRRYNFFPAQQSTFDADCLFTIAEFCERQTSEYRGEVTP